MKMKVVLPIVFGAAIMVSCSSSENIGYTVADGYFVRNDAPDEIPAVISNQREFESVFGMAAVMGPGGRPTSIDFSKQCVIPVILPSTDHPTELHVEQVSKSDSNITVSCKAVKDSKTATFIMQPCAVVIIAKPSAETSVTVDIHEATK